MHNSFKTFDINENVTAFTALSTQNLHIELDLDENNNEVTSNNVYVLTPRQELRTVAAFIKMHSLLRVNNAIDLTIIDNISYEFRFNVNYQFQSTTTNSRWTLSTWISETKPMLSLQSLFPAFNWAEREAWDMFGVFFAKHPDLRRILTDYGFVGFPLRKDFPLTGFLETQYDDVVKQVEQSSTELSQSYRLLSFTNTWPAN